MGNSTGTNGDQSNTTFSLMEGFMDWLLLISAGATLLFLMVLCICISRDQETRASIEEVGLQKESTEILHKMASKSGQAKYLASAIFLTNFVGIVILMSLYDNLSRD